MAAATYGSPNFSMTDKLPNKANQFTVKVDHHFTGNIGLAGFWLRQETHEANANYNPVNKFVGGFIGSPSMNFFKARVEKKKGLRFVEEGGAFELPVPVHLQKPLAGSHAKSVFVGLRPEHIALKGPGASRTKTAPARSRWPSMTSVSTRFFAQPRLTTRTRIASSAAPTRTSSTGSPTPRGCACTAAG